MKGPTRLGIVGCGAIADFHLKALAGVPEARCTALFDLDHERARAIRARWNLDAEILDNLDDLARITDAAVVAVPNRYHADYSIRLLRAGIHVLCEKPLAPSVSQARQMVAVAEETRAVLACGLVRRFFGATELAAEAIRRELVGSPISAEIHESSWGWPFSRAFFDRDISGGGVLIDSGPHTLDLLTYLLGQAHLVEYRDDCGGGVEANSFLKVRCDARFGPLNANIHLTRSAQIRSIWRIICTGGSIEIDSHKRDSIKLLFAGGAQPYIATADSSSTDPFIRQMSNFIAACLGQEDVRASGVESIPVLELIESCYRTRKESREPWTPHNEKHSVQVGDSNFRKVLLTGATGHIGSRFVEMSAARGDLSFLRCMTRSYHTAARIMRFPVEVVEADLLDLESVRKAMRGCDAVIHLGAGEKAGRETENITAAALEFKVRRFVHLSSACVYGLGLPAGIEKLQEDTRLHKVGELYADGKIQAEIAVGRAVRRGLPSVMLRPQVVYGPGMRWSSELMQLLAQEQMGIVEDGGWANLIYIDDLITAIIRALQTEAVNGEALFVSDGSPITWADYISAHALLIGVECPLVRRHDIARSDRGARAWIRDSFRPLLPVLATSEFRSFILSSPLMRATAFRAYLSLRERPSVSARLSKLKNGADQAPLGSRSKLSEHWLTLQLSEARLSAVRAEQLIGFKAQIDFTEGMSRSLDWFEQFGLVPAHNEIDRHMRTSLCGEVAGD